MKTGPGDEGGRAGQTWEQFETASLALAARVKDSALSADPGRAEAEREQLDDDIRPLLTEVDSLAAQLAKANAEEAPLVIGNLDARRMENVTWGAGALFAAILAALGVGTAMASLLRRQDVTIRDQLAELDERNRELDAFAGRVAHDLVSPLAPLQGHLTVARRSDAVRSDEAAAEHLRKAQDSVTRMAGLVEALLVFCRAGTPSDGAAGALDTVVTAQLMEVSQTAASNAVELHRDIGRDVLVDCPAPLLQCIAQNLLSNAVKYSAGKTGARVRVRVFADGDGYGVLHVEDNGQGIAPELVSKIGRPFFRAPTARQTPGHGLGLATTLRLVHAHGGTFALSATPGGGTTATARLPLTTISMSERRA